MTFQNIRLPSEAFVYRHVPYRHLLGDGDISPYAFFNSKDPIEIDGIGNVKGMSTNWIKLCSPLEAFKKHPERDKKGKRFRGALVKISVDVMERLPDMQITYHTPTSDPSHSTVVGDKTTAVQAVLAEHCEVVIPSEDYLF